MNRYRSIYRKKRFLIPLTIILFVGILALWYALDTAVTPPEITDKSALNWQIKESDSGLRVCEGNWLKQNKSGLWELYVKGTPFERGVANGKLTKELIAFQEEAFVSRLRELIPSEFYIRFLKYFIYWFNRDLDEYLSTEFKKEIYGVSFAANPRYNFIGSPYQRMMNYHSAHDIGHALQELSLVGCTGFAVWNNQSADSSLLIGRNFDFYMGDDFAKNKIVLFEYPDSGYAFLSVTWAGMTGVVSGMNTKGLTVTINAAKSEIPWSARTPVSLLAREILQYSATIAEAIAIAEKRETFVSESFLVGSAADNRAVVIEKSPYKLAVKEPEGNQLICTNHFQDSNFASDPLNITQKEESASFYRSLRVSQLLSRKATLSPLSAAAVLRDQAGLNNRNIGMGNEKAMNQLISHHSVIFQPGRLLAWVSTDPWQLGTYVCYDLSKVFHTFATTGPEQSVAVSDMAIRPDEFLKSTDYQLFLRFKEMRRELKEVLANNTRLQDERSFFGELILSNPEYYETWSLIGDYYFLNGDYIFARRYYIRSLQKEIPAKTEQSRIIKRLAECNVELNFNL